MVAKTRNNTANMGKPRDDDYSDDDFDDEYFSQTYRPLSNLPTPPPSSRESTAAQSPRSLLEDGGLLDSELLGEPPPPLRINSRTAS